jgi:hypothetical protein
MPTTWCYWKLCNCPTPPLNKACSQHGGFSCSLWQNQTISTETQITDTLTRELTTAIADADKDAAQLEIFQTRATQMQADIQRDNQKINEEINNADSYSSRKQAEAATEKAVDDAKKRRDEYRQMVDDSSGIVEKTVLAIDRGFYRLIIPYSNSSGYCACYQRKVKRLAGLASKITTEQTNLNTLQNFTWPTAKNRMVVALGSLVFPAFVGVVMGIKLLLAYLGFVSLGTLLPILAAIALLAAMVIIAATALYMLSVAQNIVKTRKRLLRLILLYYRVQQISTCQKHEDDDEGDVDDDYVDDDHTAADKDPDDSEWQRHVAEIVE